MQIPQQIQDLIPYKPGKPIEETKREYNLSHVIKLASNENALGPSPRVIETLRDAASQVHLYPDPSGYELRQALSQKWKVSADQIVLGNGSNELIDLLIRLFCRPGDSILTGEAAFVAYRICAQAALVDTMQVPLTAEGKFDLPAWADVLAKKEQNIPLVFLPNPNNPTGTYCGRDEVCAFLKATEKRDLLVVLDEAYFEYSRAKDYPSGLELMTDFPHVAVLRTFSKAYGLAGLRVGALITTPEIVDWIHRIRNPFNVSSLAQKAALAALSDEEHLQRSVELVWSGLDYWYQQLDRMGLPYYPSQGNFVLVDVQKDTGSLVQDFLREGLIVRPVGNYGFANHFRVTVGTPEENRQAVALFEKYLLR